MPSQACRCGQLTKPVPRSNVIDLRATRGRSLIAFMILSITGFVRLFGFLRITVKRLTRSVPKELQGVTGDKIRKAKIVENWPDVFRCIAIMVSGRMQPSHLLKKLAARARQHDPAFALREIGRVERTLFIIEWLLDRDTQRRANIGMKKGEAHHASKMPCGSDGKSKSETTPRKASTSASLFTRVLQPGTERVFCRS